MLKSRKFVILCLLAGFWLQACMSVGDSELVATAVATKLTSQRAPNVPVLPFPDNPDPNQCGIPTQWGDDGTAWLSGMYQGELVQPTVLLYDSHLRLNVAAQAPHGSQVKVILYQQNPVTDYYFVKIEGAPQPNEGWVPGPFLSFSPVSPLGSTTNN